MNYRGSLLSKVYMVRQNMSFVNNRQLIKPIFFQFPKVLRFFSQEVKIPLISQKIQYKTKLQLPSIEYLRKVNIPIVESSDQRNNNVNSYGKLFVIATPIGNFGDVTFRAINTLKQVEVIAAEDTRISNKLLKYYGIKKKMYSLHDHNEKTQTDEIFNILIKGQNVALISDAGTPLIHDPGYQLVLQAHQSNIPVVTIPGPCAAIAALSIAGLPCRRFVFEGFLPSKSTQRCRHLHTLTMEKRTMVFYESPHRLLACLEDMIQVFGKKHEIVLARELTKRFETVYRGTLTHVRDILINNPQQQKGEFVLLLSGVSKGKDMITKTDLALVKTLYNHLPKKQVVLLAAQITGKKKRLFYNLLLSM